MHLAPGCNDVARYVGEHKQKNKSYWAEEQAPVEICCEKLRCLAAVGLAHEEQHGGRECGAESHKAIHVDDGYGIQYGIHCGTYPSPYLHRDEAEYKANDIDVEEQFCWGKGIRGVPLLVRHFELCACIAQKKHKHEEGEVHTYGCERSCQ